MDFTFQLSAEEKTEVVAKCDHLASLKFSATHPYAFMEHGAIMLAAVLNTPRATEPWSHKEEDNERKKRIKRCFPEDVLQIGFRGGSGYWG